jgi:N6-L-threonylcarbamoyladenine synthase
LPLQTRADLAASTEAAIVEVLVRNRLPRCAQTGFAAGGGGRRGRQSQLRAQLNAVCCAQGVRVHYPELHLCTDNGAMIALAAAMRLQSGQAKGQRALRV